MRPADTVELCQFVNELNARRQQNVQRRVHAFLGLLLAIAVGLGLAFALIHFGMPCEGAGLYAAVLPTQRSWLQRLVLDMQRWRLLRHIRSAQQDLAYQEEALQLAQWETEHIPAQMEITRRHIEQLSIQMDCNAHPEQGR
jgi:hypothetical protein